MQWDNKIATKAIKYISKENYKKHTPDVVSRNRIEQKTRSEESRFKIISCLRATASDVYSDAEPVGDSDTEYTIVDVKLDSLEGQTTDADNKDISDSAGSSHYVYDLYSIANDINDIDDLYMDSLISVHPLACDLQYRCGEDLFDDEDITNIEDEDSNDENNWRNDYPDSDHSINEEDMNLAVRLRGCGLDDGYDLSSDDGEERYLNYEDSFASDLGGTSYARYKRKMATQGMGELKDDEDGEGQEEEY